MDLINFVFRAILELVFSVPQSRKGLHPRTPFNPLHNHIHTETGFEEVT